MKRTGFLVGLASLPVLGPLAARLLAPAESVGAKIYVGGQYASGYLYSVSRAYVMLRESLAEAEALAGTGARVVVEIDEDMAACMNLKDLPLGVAGRVFWRSAHTPGGMVAP
jgi:hypothetical protein